MSGEVGQPGPDLAAGLVQPGLEGAERDAEAVGDVGVLQVANVPVDQRRDQMRLLPLQALQRLQEVDLRAA